ncbi:MAG: SxtJ family membrane protein [Candidatus Hodarchaeota archaeon]
MVTPTIEQRELKKFGITLFFGLAALGGFILWRKGEPGFICWAIGLIMLLIGVVKPTLLLPVYKIWMTLAMTLGFIMTHLILALMYYLIFTPASLVMRVLGRDPLRTKKHHSADSYWIKRHQTKFTRERYEKMF